MIRSGLVLVLVLGANQLLGGCTAIRGRLVQTVPDEPSPGATALPQRTDRLVALAGTVGAMRLMAPEPDGTLQSLDDGGLPPAAAWLSGDGSTLLVTTLAGGLVLGNAHAGEVAWTPALGDLGGNHPLRAFGTLQPGSAPAGQIALVEGDPGSGAPGRLVVESLAGAVNLRYDLASTPESAPAWLPDGRIVVVIRNQDDAPAALILDPLSRQTTPARAGPVLSVAIGGEIVATVAPDGAVRTGSVAGWLRGEPADPIPGTGPDEPVLQAQPSVAGDELALVVANSAGDAASIRILAVAGGWHEIARFGLPGGANRAVVSWLMTP